jgi:glycosyltransferase 2 family protein
LRRSLWIALQVLLAAAVAYAVVGSIGHNWDQLTSSPTHLTLRAGPIALACLVVLATYALLIESWRRVLAGWDQRIPFAVATRIWALSNLGRYLPGKIWSVAGMAVLAQRAGIAPWAATGSAIILQALAIGTAAALVAATVPATLLAQSLPGLAPGIGVGVAFALAAATIGAVSWPPLARRLFRAVPQLGAGNAPPLKPSAIAIGTTATIVAWVAYGVALKLWAVGTLGQGADQLDLATASGAFTASYVVGLIALFAPGGILVREGVMFTLLQGTLGPGNALALAVGSRLLLTFTEIAAAVAGIAWPAGRIDVQRQA